MAERRRYTRRQKAEAVVTAEQESIAVASERSGAPESTIRYWLESPKFAELRAKTRADMAAGFDVLIHKAQARLEELIPTMEPRDLTILVGVATDKSQLLAGHATERTETRDVTERLDDHESEALREVLDKALADVAD